MRDPLLALQKVAALTTQTLIVVELVDSSYLPGWTGTETEVPPEVLGITGPPAMIFQPDASSASNAPATWWHFNPACVRQMLGVFGFEDFTTTFHIQRQHNYSHLFHTTVGVRTRGLVELSESRASRPSAGWREKTGQQSVDTSPFRSGSNHFSTCRLLTQ